jgi:hypothetical protein
VRFCAVARFLAVDELGVDSEEYVAAAVGRYAFRQPTLTAFHTGSLVVGRICCVYCSLLV